MAAHSSNSRARRTAPGLEAMSDKTRAMHARIDDAQVARSICPYCGVGCGQLIYHKDGKLISIEGDPETSDQPGKSLSERRGVLSIAHAFAARNENEISRAARERVDGDFARSRDGHGGGPRLGIAQAHVRAARKTARRSITRLRSVISAAPRSTTKKIISSKNFSLGGLGMVCISNQARI